MSIREDKARGVWFYRYSKGGKDHSEYGFKSEAEAEEAERKEQMELADSKGVGASWSFIEAIKWYLSNIPADKKTADIDRSRLGLAKKFFGDMRISEIRAEDIEEFRDKLPDLRREDTPRIRSLSKQTLNHYLRQLRTLYNRMRKRGMYTGMNPALAVDLLKVPAARVRFLYPWEEKSLTPIAMEDAVLWPYYFMALHSGCRISELMGMKVKDVDLVLNQIFIPNSKNSRSRHIRLSPDTADFVRGLVNGKRLESRLLPFWSYTHLRKRFRDACHSAGIKNLKLHDLRHSFAQYLLAKNESIYKVSKLMGHSSITVTEEHYGHLALADLAPTIAKIDGICGPDLQKGANEIAKVTVSETGKTAKYQQFSAG